jgi:cytochrome c biogenesis factor
MSAQANAVKSRNHWKLSLDIWAVVLALLAALLVRTGVFKHIPW